MGSCGSVKSLWWARMNCTRALTSITKSSMVSLLVVRKVPVEGNRVFRERNGENCFSYFLDFILH